MSALLAIRGASFDYRERAVLRDIDLVVSPGRHLCLLGENGAGKSTLLRLCAGILRPASGTITLDGGAEPLDRLPRAAVARRISYLPQEISQTFSFSALEVVLMGRYAHVRGLLERDEDLEAAERALRQTDCWHLRARPFQHLSGGERRRVALAQALAQDTPLLLLDEPTAGLDPAHALSLCRTFSSICDGGRALVWSTHDINLAARFAPEAALLHEGRLQRIGPTAEVLRDAGAAFGIPLHVGALPSGAPFAVPA